MNWKTQSISPWLWVLVHRLYQRYRWCDARHPFWYFYQHWKTHRDVLIDDFIHGRYHVLPMMGYNADGHCEPRWSYQDALFQKILYRIIKPTFKNIISPACCHLSGPSVIKKVTHALVDALSQCDYRYMIRTDIRSYDASIENALLQSMIRKHFDDANVVRYLCHFVDVPIDRGGWYEHPKKGIPMGSSLSCFFAALVLKPLDQCFDNRDDLYYCRYHDDIIILCKTKRQYTQAKRRLNTIIMALKLKMAPKKTRMGSIEKSFHFLGIQFAVARITASRSRKDSSLTSVEVSLHPRTIRRSIEKVKLKQEEERVLKGTCSLGAEPPAYVQSKRYQWAQWWARQHEQLRDCTSHITAWNAMAVRMHHHGLSVGHNEQSGFFQ